MTPSSSVITKESLTNKYGTQPVYTGVKISLGTLGVSMFTDSFGMRADHQLCGIRTGEEPVMGPVVTKFLASQLVRKGFATDAFVFCHHDPICDNCATVL